MLIHEAFDKTLKRYSITGKVLSRLANVSEAHVSQFRNGKGGAMSHTTLEDVLITLEQLAPGSKSYFYLLLAEKSIEQADIEVFVQSMDNMQIGTLLTAIARRVSPNTSPLNGDDFRLTEQVAV